MSWADGISPCWELSKECLIDWPAWGGIAQAILSALAILAAWALQSRQHRLQILQRSASILELLRTNADIAIAARKFTEAATKATLFADLDKALLEDVTAAVGQIPVHELPLARLSQPVINIVRNSRMLDANLNSAAELANSGSVVPQSLAHNIYDNCRGIAAAYSAAVDVHNEACSFWWGLSQLKHTVPQQPGA